MKQLNLLAVTLLVMLMGVSLTSCLKGDDNNMRYGAEFVRVKSTLPISFETAYGITLQPTQVVNATDKNMALINYQFDSSKVTQNAKSVTVTLLSDPYFFTEDYATASEITANAYTDMLELETNQGTIKGNFFDAKTIILPVAYKYAKFDDVNKQKEEMAKHQFKLSYDADDYSTDGSVTFYLHHIINETGTTTQRNNGISEYKAFNIANALSRLSNVTTVKVVILQDQNKEKTYTYDYKFGPLN